MKEWWVWGRDEDNALEEMYFCHEYKSEEEARHKAPTGDFAKRLFVVRVEEAKSDH